MHVSIAIQSHPERAEMAAALAEEIGDAEVVIDPDPTARIRSPWRTYQHALRLTPGFHGGFTGPGAATHRLVIQDDATVCTGFRPALEAAVAAKPENVIVLFVAGAPQEHARAVVEACERGSSWVLLDRRLWCPAVATLWPAHLIEPMLSWVEAQRWPELFTADDEIIGRFLNHHEIVPIATAPSLVEHLDEVPSLLGKRHFSGLNPDRVAACYIGDCDPAQIDWAVGP